MAVSMKEHPRPYVIQKELAPIEDAPTSANSYTQKAPRETRSANSYSFSVRSAGSIDTVMTLFCLSSTLRTKSRMSSLVSAFVISM